MGPRWPILGLLLGIFTVVPILVVDATDPARLELTISASHVVLGEIVRVTGVLREVVGGQPIPLAPVALRYVYGSTGEVVRNVSLITSTPQGRFEDLVNSTTLGRVGLWLVVVEFPGVRGFTPTNAFGRFNIVVQPQLTLEARPARLDVGEVMEVMGGVFPCLPCEDAMVRLIFTSPNGSVAIRAVAVRPAGGPYPAGRFTATLRPDAVGAWRIEAEWPANPVSLAGRSGPIVITVQSRGEAIGFSGGFAAALAGLVVLSLGAVLWWRRSRARRPPPQRTDMLWEHGRLRQAVHT